MGDRLRAARLERGLSVRRLAERLDVSPSLVSQVETGRARPSVNTLYAIASELGLSLDELLFLEPRSSGADGADTPSAAVASPDPLGLHLPDVAVQRSTTRQTIRLASGVVWERLTTASLGSVDFLYVTYEVGGASSLEDALHRHPGQELGYIISGTLEVRVGFEVHRLEAGDAIAFDSTTPHRLYNVGDTPVHAVWLGVGRRRFDRLGGDHDEPVSHRG
jgi:transcriptional regulator with XRE-family HTH domain/quercetin dioxygenase-like cupin family protein